MVFVTKKKVFETCDWEMNLLGTSFVDAQGNRVIGLNVKSNNVEVFNAKIDISSWKQITSTILNGKMVLDLSQYEKE